VQVKLFRLWASSFPLRFASNAEMRATGRCMSRTEFQLCCNNRLLVLRSQAAMPNNLLTKRASPFALVLQPVNGFGVRGQFVGGHGGCWPVLHDFHRLAEKTGGRFGVPSV
jgi:hypothetical protein